MERNPERKLSAGVKVRSKANSVSRAGVIGLVVIAAASLAGCRPNNGAAGSSPTTVRLAFFPNVTHAVALVGTSRGTFAKALGPGVTLEEQSFAAGPSEVEAVFGGQVDIGYIGPGPAINGFVKSHGEVLKIVAGASSGGTALVVRADSGITEVKALAGKRVAVPQIGGTQDISLRHALSTAGLTSTDKGGTVSVLGNAPADTLTLFVKKELDAAWLTEPWVSRLVKEGNGKILLDERDLWPGRKFATTVVIVRSQFLKEHPDLVAKFMDVHIETVDWIVTHRDEAATAISERLKKLTGKALPADILKTSLERTDLTYDPLRDTVLTFADWSKALGYQKSDRTALSGLIDLQPLNAALAKRGKPTIP